MANLGNAIQQLRQERKQAQSQLEKLDSAISVLEGLTTNSPTGARNGAGPKRVMSAAARRRIAQAQRTRWAKVRANSQSKQPRKAAITAGPRRTLSTAARRKIAAAQRARWARVRAQQAKRAA